MASSMGEGMVIMMPKSPIFIINKPGIDIGVFSSIEDAQQQLEPIDVQNDEYVCYDADGVHLGMHLEGNRVIITPAEDNPKHAKELEAAIRAYLNAICDPIASEPTIDLANLVAHCNRFVYVPRTPKDAILDAGRRWIGKIFRDRK